MKRTATLALSVMLSCISCGRDSDALRIELEKHATEIANQVKDQAQALPNAEQIKAEIERLIAAVEEKDIGRLKDACNVVDVRLGTRILGRYYKAFALEIEEGPPSVIEYLNAEIDKLDEGDAERAAITGLRKYFEAKGTLTTKDAAVLILVVALEAKFPHGRGTIFLVPFLDSGKPENGPEKHQIPRG